jgi:hypothetical protein
MIRRGFPGGLLTSSALGVVVNDYPHARASTTDTDGDGTAEAHLKRTAALTQERLEVGWVTQRRGTPSARGDSRLRCRRLRTRFHYSLAWSATVGRIGQESV